MQHLEGTFPGVDGIQLFYQCWRPAAVPPRAALVSLHGNGAHSDHEAVVAEYLVPRGYAYYGMDLRGHGRSQGRRGHIRSWQDYRDDLAAFLALVAAREPGRPRFLLGVSMGALIALDYVLCAPGGPDLSGVVAQAPPIGRVGASPLRIALARALSRIWPTLTLDTKTDPAAVSRDAAFVEEVRSDPRWFSDVTVRLVSEALDARARVHARAAMLRVPVLILHGAADRVALPDGSRRLRAAAREGVVELREYEGGYHNLFHDTATPTVLADLDAWLSRHVPAAGPVG
jgi:alpha-beta hydrolase superfamily lysophospholipase